MMGWKSPGRTRDLRYGNNHPFIVRRMSGAAHRRAYGLSGAPWTSEGSTSFSARARQVVECSQSMERRATSSVIPFTLADVALRSAVRSYAAQHPVHHGGQPRLSGDQL